MEDRPISPRRRRPLMVRSCEISRLQGQLLADAYQRLCPQIRHKLPSSSTDQMNRSTAARRAAGA